MNYTDYLAALERLRRVESGESFVAVYGNNSFDSLSRANDDKLTVYDAEHDTRPATVEWLREVFGKPWYEGIDVTTWQHGDFHIEYHPGGVVRMTCGHKIALDDNNFDVRNPTRGDVLRLLRVFAERKV